MGSMSRNDGYTRYTVRIPTPLYERVKAAAGEASVNAEIVATLEEKYPAPTFDPKDAAREYRDLAMVLAFDGATDEERAKAVERLNELDRLYKQATGEDI